MRIARASALYQVGGLSDPERSYLDGLHAKSLLIEDGHRRSRTFVGSANATRSRK